MSLSYKIDSKYSKGKHFYFEDIIIDFFKEHIGYDLSKTSLTDKTLHGADFVIYNNEKLIEIAEIKTEDETKNCSAWISWHSPKTKSGDDAIKRFSDDFYNLDKLTQCFAVAIGIQMFDYLKNVNLNHIWLIQENEKYEHAIKDACEFLKKEGLVKSCQIVTFRDCVFAKVSV
ncbi:hypothetical protein [Hippea sp. KM1]|uniref:hypothetical protein n=1 Tax=Hippea sp. KM1 TaxID=944481 RepID=UPI00046D464D|nr:hypothetical protein [Hippea sp. KM1]